MSHEMREMAEAMKVLHKIKTKHLSKMHDETVIKIEVLRGFHNQGVCINSSGYKLQTK